MSEQSEISIRPARSGPKHYQPRDGDKKQARRRINVEVRTGRRAHPNALTCAGCGHVWSEGERRHEYHHHLGYGAENHYNVIALCTECHSVADNEKATWTHCPRGHEFTPENTAIKKNGCRQCRECARHRDRSRLDRDAAYWREYRRKRKNHSSEARA
jgi:hypothetical protein